MVVVVVDALARRIKPRLPDIGNEVDEGMRVVAPLVGLSAPVARHGGKDGLRRRAEVILAAVEALRENVGAERAYALPRLELDLVHVDRAALVDGNAFLLQEAPVSARPVEDDRVVVGISPRLGGLGCLSLSLCPQRNRRAGCDSR